VTSIDFPQPRRTQRQLAADWESREIMHDVLTFQFGNGAAARVGATFEREVLRRVAADIASRLDSLPRGRAFVEHRRARFLLQAIREIVRKGSGRARSALLSEARDLAQIEVQWLKETGKSILGVEFRTPPASVVEAATTKQPMLGRKFGEWFDDWVPRATERKIVARVQAGMVAGESTPQIVRSLQGTKALRYTNGQMVEARRAMRMMTRTVMTHTAAVARDITFRRNADVVPKVRWVSTLDLRTSEICASLDGKTWATDSAHPTPPQHPNCRSTLQPVVGRPAGNRASLGGQVPAGTRYREWLRTRSAAEQDMVLGPTKAAAWRAGKLTLDDMVDASLSRVLSLDELRLLHKL